MGLLELSTWIRAPVGRCFDLARSIEAHCESARSTAERVVEPGRLSGLLGLGDRVTFEARHLGLRRRLTAEIVEFEPPHRFVDVMVRGPFRSLRHEHRFAAHADGTRMHDVLRWELPCGVAGRVADRLVVTPHLRRFLSVRAEHLKRHAEAGR
ncbi:MAG: SRPBCC family protein [Planctomycetota bacterium]